ncbi:SDR family oxidoreductase [Amnibacterium flavum]|uniref:Oxidoreductase n=1 Tax=Amnibacterium flavum TaxID=2173173 RepID=A0A2V1HX95_9MICO|nr:SDR family oxidoreductase [Amnibacterium flavum]PVZ95237.1 oxidoreductase [Amnibacterium flavum]
MTATTSRGALGGKVALVTGGSRGIGAGIAIALAAEGAAVVVTYAKSADRAEAVVAEITSRGGAASAVRADSADVEEAVGTVDRAVAEFGGLDILVNNAGGGRLDPLDVATRDEIQWILDVNVRATILVTKQALLHLPRGGRIINIGSINADRMPVPGGSAYSLSKGAIAGFTRGLARELGPRGITVNNIQPGPVDTELNSSTGPLATAMFQHLALDRFGTVEEVGALAVFLAGPQADFITGSSISIDGGFGA